MIDFSSFDFPRIVSVIQGTTNLKRNQTRPLRAEIIELAIEKYSNGQLKYIGDSTNGRDYISTSAPHEAYECKTMEGLFQPKSTHTKPIILMNFRESVQRTVVKTFDYMILVDTKRNHFGVCDWDACTENLEDNGATATTRIDQSKISMIATSVSPITPVVDISLKLKKLIYESI